MKYIVIILLLITITGCKKEDRVNKIRKVDKIENIDNKGYEDEYNDTNPIKVGLYQNNKLVKETTYTKANFKEVGTYNAYYTNKAQVENDSVKNNWYRYFKQYNDIKDYKTGFYVSFEVNGTKYEQTILDPSSKHKLTPYLYIYLYDSYNYKPGTTYTHLEMGDVKDNTVYTSIKVYLAQEGSKITSPIYLDVFTYKDGDINENGYYRGNSKHSIKINLK